MKTKILFRCDAGKVKKIGTGHLFRSIFIAKILKKKLNLKNKEIKFLIKSNKKYKIASKILNENKLQFISFNEKFLKENSLSEIETLKKNKAKILIIDNWSKIELKTIKKIKNYFKKIILIDDRSNHNYIDLRINSLVGKNISIKNQRSFKNLILPSYEKKDLINKKPKFKKNIKNVFINLGGWDKNYYTKLILDIIKSFDLDLNVYLSSHVKKTRSIKFKKIKIIYFPKKNFYEKLVNSDVSIVSGGLVMFDSLFFRIPTICLPQDKDQYFNAKRVNYFNANLIIKPKNIKKSFEYNFNSLYKNNTLRKKLIKNSKKIVKIRDMKNVLENLINKCKICHDA